MPSVPYFLCFNGKKGSYVLTPCHPYLICCVFNDTTRLYHLVKCHPYLNFCVLMKLKGHIVQWHAIRTLFFVLMKLRRDIIW